MHVLIAFGGGYEAKVKLIDKFIEIGRDVYYGLVSRSKYIWLECSKCVVKDTLGHLSARLVDRSNCFCSIERQVIWSNPNNRPIFLMEIQHVMMKSK